MPEKLVLRAFAFFLNILFLIAGGALTLAGISGLLFTGLWMVSYYSFPVLVVSTILGVATVAASILGMAEVISLSRNSLIAYTALIAFIAVGQLVTFGIVLGGSLGVMIIAPIVLLAVGGVQLAAFLLSLGRLGVFSPKQPDNLRAIQDNRTIQLDSTMSAVERNTYTGFDLPVRKVESSENAPGRVAGREPVKFSRSHSPDSLHDVIIKPTASRAPPNVPIPPLPGSINGGDDRSVSDLSEISLDRQKAFSPVSSMAEETMIDNASPGSSKRTKSISSVEALITPVNDESSVMGSPHLGNLFGTSKSIQRESEPASVARTRNHPPITSLKNLFKKPEQQRTEAFKNRQNSQCDNKFKKSVADTSAEPLVDAVRGMYKKPDEDETIVDEVKEVEAPKPAPITAIRNLFKSPEPVETEPVKEVENAKEIVAPQPAAPIVSVRNLFATPEPSEAKLAEEEPTTEKEIAAPKPAPITSVRNLFATHEPSDAKPTVQAPVPDKEIAAPNPAPITSVRNLFATPEPTEPELVKEEAVPVKDAVVSQPAPFTSVRNLFETPEPTEVEPVKKAEPVQVKDVPAPKPIAAIRNLFEPEQAELEQEKIVAPKPGPVSAIRDMFEQDQTESEVVKDVVAPKLFEVRKLDSSTDEVFKKSLATPLAKRGSEPVASIRSMFENAISREDDVTTVDAAHKPQGSIAAVSNLFDGSLDQQ